MSQAQEASSKINQVLKRIQGGEVLIVSSRRRSGVILEKPYHAEFAGPGSVVGGSWDRDCQQLIPLGKLTLVQPESPEDQHRAYLIRRQWILLTQQLTKHSDPQERARMILNQLEVYFDLEMIAHLSDQVFAHLVGVFPVTVHRSRQLN